MTRSSDLEKQGFFCCSSKLTGDEIGKNSETLNLFLYFKMCDWYFSLQGYYENQVRKCI